MKYYIQPDQIGSGYEALIFWPDDNGKLHVYRQLAGDDDEVHVETREFVGAFTVADWVDFARWLLTWGPIEMEEYPNRAPANLPKTPAESRQLPHRQAEGADGLQT